MATEGKDIAWQQWAWCGGALLAGVAIGTFVIAPVWEKMQAKKEAKKKTTPPQGAVKK